MALLTSHSFSSYLIFSFPHYIKFLFLFLKLFSIFLDRKYFILMLLMFFINRKSIRNSTNFEAAKREREREREREMNPQVSLLLMMMEFYLKTSFLMKIKGEIQNYPHHYLNADGVLLLLLFSINMLTIAFFIFLLYSKYNVINILIKFRHKLKEVNIK